MKTNYQQTDVSQLASTSSNIDRVKDTIREYMHELNAPFVEDAYNQKFNDDCIAYMASRGWSEEAQAAGRVFLIPGMGIARTAYSHLENYTTQIYIAVYTSLLIYMDDISCNEQVQGLKSFSNKFMRGLPQDHDVLDAVADILRETPEHYGDIPAGIIVSATLRYITAIVLEEEVPQTTKSSGNINTHFPRFLRELSGVPDAYSMFTFPPSIPYTAYVQALPDMNMIFCYANDVLSFYKEELKNEEANLISLLAKSKGASKIDVHRQLMEEALECDRAVFDVLKGNSEATACFENLRTGYVAFHTCLQRYKLRELLDI